MDWIVSVLTIIQMQLIAQKIWYGWVVALVNSGLWMILSYQQGLWGLVALQLVLSAQFCFALIAWSQKGTENE